MSWVEDKQKAGDEEDIRMMRDEEEKKLMVT